MKLKTTSKVADDLFCPKCGTSLDSATSVDSVAKPKPNDVSVCIKCGAMLRYNDTMTLFELRAHEFEELDKETQGVLLRVQQNIRAVHAKREEVEKIYLQLKKDYTKAVTENKEEFVSSGHTFVTMFAKYQLEYWQKKYRL